MDDARAVAALRGLRGVPNEVAVLGASNYLNETLRPGGTHARKHMLVVDSAPSVAGRGKMPLDRSRPVCMDAAAATATVAEALTAAAAMADATAPVRINDAKEVAAATTKELTEREQEV